MFQGDEVETMTKMEFEWRDGMVGGLGELN